MQFHSDAEHFEHVLHDLGERIARLALACELDLGQAALVEQVLHDEAFAQAHPSRYFKELRGLLILRYLEEKRCAEDLGSATCVRLMMEAESHLISEGFEPGSDGCDPGKLLRFYQSHL
jgi:hypothetical protein